MEPWIQTYTGKVFRFDEISHNQFDILDIVNALSNICRYTGHTNQYYSVAQHCVYAHKFANPSHKRAALLHDLSEAYLSDLSSPLKMLLPGYKELEDKIMFEASEVFDFEYPLSKEVKDVDIRLLQTERLQLLGKEPKPWGLEGIEPYDLKIYGWNPAYAYEMFLRACAVEKLI